MMIIRSLRIPALIAALALVAGAGQAAILYTPSQYKKVYNDKVALELELKSLRRQYQNEKANLQAQIADLTATIDRLNRDIDNLKKKMAESAEICAQRIKELEDRTDILKMQGSQREQELIEQNRQQERRCSEELQKKMDELQRERDRCALDLKNLTDAKDKKIADLTARITALNNELSELKKLTKKQKEELERMSSQASELEKQLQDEIAKGNIRLKKFHDRIIINIDDRISFDSGSAELKREIMSALDKITKILGDYPENRIIVEGHTDNVPIRSARFRDNWQLSTERALAVLRYLLREKGLNAMRFSAAGYGEWNPVVPNDTDANRALNRRVDIVVVPVLSR